MSKTTPQNIVQNVAPVPRVAVPVGELLVSINLPESTFLAEQAAGRGCKTFKIGRRKYALLTDWAAWLESRAAETGGAGPDSAKLVM